MDKFEKVKTLEAAEFYVFEQPPADWNVVGWQPGNTAVKFIDGSVEVFTHEEAKNLEFKLRPKKDDA